MSRAILFFPRQQPTPRERERALRDAGLNRLLAACYLKSAYDAQTSGPRGHRGLEIDVTAAAQSYLRATHQLRRLQGGA